MKSKGEDAMGKGGGGDLVFYRFLIFFFFLSQI